MNSSRLLRVAVGLAFAVPGAVVAQPAAVDDVAVTAAAIGRSTGSTPRVLEFPQHGIRILQLQDPDGNIIQLSSPLRPR